MNTRGSAWALAALVSLGPVALFAAPPKESKAVEAKEVKTAARKDAASDQAAMEKEAKITMEQARKIALGKVKNGKIESGELEREHGKLIYSFDIKSPKGVTEVNVDALDGKIVAVQHENAAKEAAEKKQEAKEKAATKPN
jgi:Peptidase propeptide and YPEB domain